MVHVAQTNRADLLFHDGAKIHLGEVDGARTHAKVEVAAQRIAHLHTNSSLSLLGAATNVGCHDDIGLALKFRSPFIQVIVEGIDAVLSRLTWVDVERTTANVLRLEGLNQSRNLHHGATCIVDEEGARFHERKLPFANHAACLWQFRHMDAHKVGFTKKLFERVSLARTTQGHKRHDVVVNDLHAHRFGKDRELRANVTISHNAKKLATELKAPL